MGRPIKKSNFGSLAGAGQQVQVLAWAEGDTQARVGFIVRQRSKTSYIVNTTANGGVIGRARLQATTPTAIRQMTLKVFPYGTSAEGTGATATSVMRAKTIAVNVGGTGYTTGNVITVTGGTGTSITATVTATAGAVTGLTLVNLGAYTALPTVTGAATTVAPSGGTGLTVNLTFELGTVNVTAGGQDYQAATAAFTGASTTAATVVITNGSVSGFTFTNRGTYTTVPTIAITSTGTSSTVEYAFNLAQHLVKTFSGNVYKWRSQAEDLQGPGEAHIETA